LSLLEEHAEIVTTLRSAEREGGALGHAARDVLAALEPHLALEQAVALPSLRLLPRLAANEVDAGMTDLIGVSERLRAELPTLRRQHRALVPRLESLYSEAWAAGRSDYAFFAQGLLRHIRVDEEVLYPAALVAGDHARVLLGRGLSD
jgi:hypothetical protein